MLTKSTHTGEKENPYPGVGSLWGGIAFVLEFAVQSRASHFVTIAKRVSAQTHLRFLLTGRFSGSHVNQNPAELKCQ